MEFLIKNEFLASVIIPTYNRCDLLKLTLDSMLSQSIEQSSIEILVIDDGSSDNTYNVAKDYSNKMNLKYFFQEDKGFRAAAARNIGIRNAKSEICIFVDTGILFGKNAVEEHIKTHKQGSNCATIGYVYGFDDFGKHDDIIKEILDNNSVDDAIEKLNDLNIYDEREELFYSKLGDKINDWPVPWVAFWTSNVSVSTKALFDANLFDENYTSWGCEDVDLGIALNILKTEFILNRKIKSLHYPHKKTNPFSMKDKAGIDEFHRKLDYIHKKYNTKATKLYLRHDLAEINELILKSER